ncbi:MAG: GNAT family N-acetyltransferase [Anaerolineae bacterium]
MDFEVQVVHSVEEVGEEAWDHLSRGRPFTSYRWYRFGEKAMAYARPCYAILSHHGEPLARATFWLTPRELIPVRSGLVRWFLGSLIRRWPLLICQSPLTSSAATSGLSLPEPPLREPVLTALAEVGRELAERYKTSFCLFGYLEEAEARRRGWPRGYVPSYMWGSGTRLAIEWEDFEGYLAHLSKKRRYNVRRNRRLGEEQGIEIRRHAAVTDVEGALVLHRNVNARHHSPIEPWMPGAFEHAAMVDAIWLTAEVEGRMVGCELMLGDRDVWLVTGLGLDYSVDYAYFLLGYADIECAIEKRARMLRWGSLTYHVKRRLGFEMESNDWVVYSGRGALLQRLGRWLADREESRYEDADEE